jgi:hypothetical protein
MAGPSKTLTIRWSTDLRTGLLFAAIAMAGGSIGARYPFGDPSHMGAGFFPKAVCGLLALIGAGLVARSFVGEQDQVGEVDPRPLLLLAGTLAFGLVIDNLGFPLAGVLLVLFAHLGGRVFKPIGTTVLAVGLVGLCVLVFVYGLGLNLPMTRFR